MWKKNKTQEEKKEKRKEKENTQKGGKEQVLDLLQGAQFHSISKNKHL